MARPLALSALVLVPLVAAAWAPAPTTGTTGDTETTTASSTEADTADSDASGTMPPVYEPCGCASAGEAGGWAVLALLFTAGSPCRRRRPTS